MIQHFFIKQRLHPGLFLALLDDSCLKWKRAYDFFKKNKKLISNIT
jgi:hypothetical protein